MKWFYMQAGAMPLLIAALAALYLRPGKRSPPEEADDGRQYYDGNGNHVLLRPPADRPSGKRERRRTTRKQPLKNPNHHASNYRRKALGGA